MLQKAYDITAIGELLIDFTPAGKNAQGSSLFAANPGGAPGNVLALASKLGLKTALIAKVGEDQFGTYLEGVLDGVGVDKKGLVRTADANTTLAFVHLNESGDRSFNFYRKPGADMLLAVDDLDARMLESTRIFHFGSVSMTGGPSRETTLKAVEAAKKSGALVSFDPNLRPPLWTSLDEAKIQIVKGLGYADILKVSEEELEFITGEGGLESGSKLLAEKYGIPLILVTLGPKGCFYKYGDLTGSTPAYKVKTLDTTGAGDAFLGAFLYKVARRGCSLAGITPEEMEGMAAFANAAGSLATSVMGAIPAMPTLEEIEGCVRGNILLQEERHG